MRRISLATAGICLALLAIAGNNPGPAVDPYLLERLLPQDVAFYAVLPNHPAVIESLRATKLHKLSRDPDIKNFLKTYKPQIEFVTLQADAKLKPFGISFKGLLGLLQSSSFSIAVIDIPREGEPPKDLVFAVAPRSTDVNFGSVLVKFKEEAASKNAKLTSNTFDFKGKSYESFGADAHILYHAQIENAFVFATSKERMESLIANSIEPPPQSLKNDKKFTNAAAKVCEKGRELYMVYFNAGAFIEKMSAKAGEHDLKMAGIVGALDIESVALALSPNGENFSGNLFVGVKGEKKGLVKLLSPKPIASKNLKYVPANAFLCAAANLDLKATINDLFAIAKEAEGDRFKGERDLMKADEALGISVKDDLFGSIGNDIVFFSAFPESGGLVPDFMLIASLNDAARFEKAFSAIVGKVSDKGVQESVYQGTTIKAAYVVLNSADYWISGKSATWPVSYFVRDNTLFLTTSPDALKREIRRMNNTGTDGLPQSKKFTAIAGGLQSNAGALCYVDVEALFNVLANTVSPFLGYVQLFVEKGSKGGLPFKPETLPLGETVGGYLGQTIVAVSDDQGSGIKATVNSSFPFHTGIVYLLLSLFEE